ncbi:MAG: hypothetical protein Q8S00_27610 [Deltaproteobacteria bacterium]|nr:hypothetical protein [Deltaproteobacteria bacterium]MDZ4346818.1 hypothetical protein [Candidatus Binatia bacterium]
MGLMGHALALPLRTHPAKSVPMIWDSYGTNGTPLHPEKKALQKRQPSQQQAGRVEDAKKAYISGMHQL